MAGGDTSTGEKYPTWIAYIYVFNLVVGVGALNLPSGFYQAGLVLGLIFLALMGFLAYISITWINEVQASANAILSLKERGFEASDKPSNNYSIQSQESSESTTLLGDEKNTSIFEISRRVEVGLMSELFLGRIGYYCFYVIIIIYLYGDLAIYAVTIPKSLQTVTGGWHTSSVNVSEKNVYYVYLAIFSVFIVPWTFFNFQKTKPLQLFTIATRNIALFMMIIICLIYIGEGEGASAKQLPFFDFTGLPALFGVTIYAFMCHHSLPGLLSPVKDKKHLNRLMLGDFITIYIVYGGLCASALFAFGTVTNPTCPNYPGNPCQIQQLFTLNFSSYDVKPIAYFLSLYPVFTLTTNFPLIAITLRNNIILLVPVLKNRPQLKQIIFALIATLPPIAVAFATEDVGFLVSITGSYAGLGIMFVMPALLVLFSRRKIAKLERDLGMTLKNPHKSFFAHTAWVVAILVISIACVGLVTFNHIWDAVQKHRHPELLNIQHL